jgi:glycogen synthase
MIQLFEISWEVCNKVGGIYTVLSSKSDYLKEKFKKQYFIGPYLSNQNSEFEEKEIPEDFKQSYELLKSKKIFLHYGIWKKTNVETFLIDFSEFMQEKNEIKKKLWEDYQIDSLNSNFWFDEPIVWSYAVGIFLESIFREDEKIVAHFHEWLAGAGLLYLKSRGIKIGKVFTTHATVLGRAMADRNQIFNHGNPDEEARNLNVIDKHLVEKNSAINAEVFTTVSELTAEECEKILGKRPKVIINGIDLNIMPNMEEVPEMHRKNKEKIKDLIMSNFFPYYNFDLEKCLFYYISGRYEVHAKGIDTYIKALGNLNKRLKNENSEKMIIAFFLIPSDFEKENPALLKNLFLLKEIKEKIQDYSDYAKNKILPYIFLGKNEKLIPKKLFSESEKLVKISGRNGIPESSTHYLKQGDRIINLLNEEELENKKDDKVKVLFYPAYLSEQDGILNMEYYDVVSGFHLGVFPSFYEPWGYTPFESACLGVPTITTDLSGFGKYVNKYKKEQGGIIVLNREGKTDEEISKELEEEMYSYLNSDKIERIRQKAVAQSFAHKLSWKEITEDYIDSYKDSLYLVLKD